MGKYALLIGVGEYGEGLQPLPAAPNDIAALKKVLEDPKMAGFDEVKDIVNPTHAEMAREIELWFQRREPEDLVLLFFSGHGVKDDSRELYFASRNTEKVRNSLLISTATSARFVSERIRRCKAKQLILILDCCFSGAFGDLVGRDDGEVDLQDQLGAEGRVVLTSTSAVDYSFEEKETDCSIYTRYLVEGIATGAADEDGDGFITVDELHRYAGRKVEEASPAMSPKIFIPQGEGYRIRLARSPQDDPKLRYRKEVEKRADASEFSIPAKMLLIDFRREFGVSDEDAETIEAGVLRPYREYEQKRNKYQNALKQCLQQENPLKLRTIRDLRDLRDHLQLKPQDVVAIEREILGSELVPFDSPPPPPKNAPSKNSPPEVDRKELIECDPSKILFLKNVRDLDGDWAYTIDRIRDMGGVVESRVFELFWLSTSRGAKTASKGDLMLLNQFAKITHVVEMLDDEVRENEAGYFRWVRVVWMPEEEDWAQLTHQRDVIGFEPPTIGGGTAYSLANLSKFQETWDSLEAFQQHVVQVLTGAKPPVPGEVDESLSSERFGANYYAKLRDLLAAQDWKAADQETAQLMCEVMDRQLHGYLSPEDMKNFPCQDLRNINSLWVKYSNGKFGFSVQKEIWRSYGSPISSNKWGKFGAAIGWLKRKFFSIFLECGGDYLRYSQLTFDLSAPRGHLPALCMIQDSSYSRHVGDNTLLLSWLDGRFKCLLARPDL